VHHQEAEVALQVEVALQDQQAVPQVQEEINR